MRANPVILPYVLASKLPALKDICQRFHIKNLWAFGSVLTEEFREDSDIDFLYEWDRPAIKDKEYLPNLDGCMAALELLFGRNIDFVHYPTLTNPYFLQSVEATKVLLYAQRSEKVSV